MHVIKLPSGMFVNLEGFTSCNWFIPSSNDSPEPWCGMKWLGDVIFEFGGDDAKAVVAELYRLAGGGRKAPEVQALVEAEKQWAKLGGLLTVAFAELEHTHPDWVHERWLGVSSAIVATTQALVPYEADSG